MPSSYAIQTFTYHETMGDLIDKQTVVYADTELEARVAGAAQLGVDASVVKVTEIGTTPSDAELNDRQRQIRESTDIPDYMRNVHE